MYLVGVLWQSVLRVVARFVGIRLGRRGLREVYRATSRAVFAGVSGRVLEQLVEVTAVRLRQELKAGTSSQCASDFRSARARLADRSDEGENALVRAGAEALVSQAARELLELVPTRLITAEKELWAGWDQARAEAEFRATLAIPLAGLAGTLGVVYHPLWWGGVVVALLLLRIGSESGERGTEVLLEAVRARKAVLFEDGALPDVPWNTFIGSEVRASVR